jgi:hypothetical protein
MQLAKRKVMTHNFSEFPREQQAPERQMQLRCHHNWRQKGGAGLAKETTSAILFFHFSFTIHHIFLFS